MRILSSDAIRQTVLAGVLLTPLTWVCKQFRVTSTFPYPQPLAARYRELAERLFPVVYGAAPIASHVLQREVQQFPHDPVVVRNRLALFEHIRNARIQWLDGIGRVSLGHLNGRAQDAIA